MRVIGFNFTKIAADRFEARPNAISADIRFLEIEKEEIPLLKEEGAIRAAFSFIVNYSEDENKEKEGNAGKLEFKGFIVLSVSKEELKETLKSWKKKELLSTLKAPLFNLILKKCTVKALDLEDQLGLPSHLPFPQIKAEPNSEKKE